MLKHTPQYNFFYQIILEVGSRMSYKSAINQPERVFLNSNDAVAPPPVAPPNDPNANSFYSFRIQTPNPILKPERMQLLRAAIPNIEVNIPNYDLIFWYGRYNTVGPLVFELKNVRFLPTYFDPAGNAHGLPINRQIVNYQDLLQLLNQAAAAADSAIQNPYHTAGDVTFNFDPVTRKFSFQGNDAGYDYVELGYADPRIEAARNNVYIADNGVVPLPASRQPTIPQSNLNLRCGYSWYGDNGDIGIDVPNPSGTPIPAQSYGNLVYSQCVYLFSNIVQGSSLGSGGQRNLLSVVPISAPSLGVALYQAPLVNWLTKIAQEIFEIEITMLDDNYQPYYVPNNAIVNVELGFSYISV